MNLLFARICVAVCGLSVPFMLTGQVWALAVFVLALAGVLYYPRAQKKSLDLQN